MALIAEHYALELRTMEPWVEGVMPYYLGPNTPNIMGKGETIPYITFNL
jgi:hypothetical protein